MAPVGLSFSTQPSRRTGRLPKGVLTARSVCVAYTDVCHGPCMSFFASCVYPGPTCVTMGTTNDLTCNCDNNLLGYLVK
jgi:hypothetical protein